ncbi:hypothetical protein EV182_001910 [Spiromyces aspiralis]|uniref:Uncharacterized protein n=1 Tax=Spiromyces aspiralis TaxID=68401 RepID=A0ACC1HYL6_9FUNG|nr:hypothetical protein EV182_001910 [Spiromyces aspiralis]
MAGLSVNCLRYRAHQYVAHPIARRHFSASTRAQGDAGQAVDVEATQAPTDPLLDPDIQDLLVSTMTTHLPFIFQLTQALLETGHDMFGTTVVPWWAVIVGSAWLLRLTTTFPIAIYQQRTQARRQQLAPEIKAIVGQEMGKIRRQLRVPGSKARPSLQQVNQIINSQVKKRVTELYVKHGCHPVFEILLPFVQIPLWLTVSFTLRHMCGLPIPFVTYPEVGPGQTLPILPVEGMTSEGLLWFSNLQVPDTTWLLPLGVGVMYELNSLLVYRRASAMREQQQAVAEEASNDVRAAKRIPLSRRLLDAAMFVMPVVMVPIAGYLPSALNLYWIASAAFSLTQNIVFGNSWIRHRMGFIPLPKRPMQGK